MALDHLDTLVETVRSHVGPARARQLAWVANELATYTLTRPALPRAPIDGPAHSAVDGRVTGDGFARPVPDLATLLSTEHLSDYLAAADIGLLRTRTPGAARPSPLGTRRVRRTCLRMLTAWAQLPSPALPPADGPTRPLSTTTVEARRAVAVLTTEAKDPAARPLLVRTALVAALVHHHDLRVGEIAALKVEDLNLGPTADSPGTLTYVPDPPGEPGTYAPVAFFLDPSVWSLTLRWLSVRERLIEAAGTARTSTLLVSVHGNHDGSGLRRPPGLPVHARGLTRAHVRAVERLSDILAARHAADPDWRPLPRTLGALRGQAHHQDA